jgi:hypothetical protein
MIPFDKLEKVLVRNSYYWGRSVSRYNLAFALRDGEKLQNDEIVVKCVDIRNRCFQSASPVCFNWVWDKYLTFRGPCIVIYSYNRRQQDALYFGKQLYVFRTDLLSIIGSLITVFTATSICHTSYFGCLVARSAWKYD